MSAIDPTAPEPEPLVDGSDPTTCRLLDELAANATVAPVTRLVDGWLAKAAPGLPFRRANAVLPPSAAGDDARSATHALDVLDAWYRSLGQRLLVQVPTADRALDDLLAARGLTIEAPVDILVSGIEAIVESGARAADRLRVAVEEQEATTTRPVGAGSGRRVDGHDVAPVAVRVAAGIDEQWARRHGHLHAGDDERWRRRTQAYGQMLSGLGPDALAATAERAAPARATGGTPGPEVVGVGFAALERGWAGVLGMATAESWRRRGVGGAVLGALAGAAHERGAHQLYLQVEADNAPGHALYRGLGFTRSHGYHYRVSEERP